MTQTDQMEKRFKFCKRNFIALREHIEITSYRRVWQKKKNSTFVFTELNT